MRVAPTAEARTVLLEEAVLRASRRPVITDKVLPPVPERMSDGRINNCALANADHEENCQVCMGVCPDRSRFDPDGIEIGPVSEPVPSARAVALGSLTAHPPPQTLAEKIRARGADRGAVLVATGETLTPDRDPTLREAKRQLGG